MDKKFVLEEDELDDLYHCFQLLIESDKFDELNDGYKLYGKVKEWMEQLQEPKKEALP